MATKQRGRASGFSPGRPAPKPIATPVGNEATETEPLQEGNKMTASNPLRAQIPAEGITVIGEALRRVVPESAEIVAEITASAPGAAQALRDCQTKTTQVGQALAPLGVQAADVQTISLGAVGLYSGAVPVLGQYAGMPQIGAGGIPGFPSGSTLVPEVQVSAYHARNTLRINVREPGRVGEVVDAVIRAGATVVGRFSFRAADEGTARRAALEAAGRDARAKAEALATASGRQIGEPIYVAEEIIASNGAYAALHSALPFAFGAGAPPAVGELEYYARVSASFRFQ
ncbi:MAG: hypothetical protein C5B51_16770 [Terriglobia bacterium]|nr:MAG: hypothetical protein C5B51_16770 [Terriglobia bacterium]